ncbi:hypothetical protein MUO83_07885 [Candidatus Bathyarchaeota archaeon]|nr:hypothetical protein [Candidatus Bathyarchaeota archaeon]
MPPRKYDTEEKTTTPDGYREYKKLQMRDIREQERKETDQNQVKIDELTKAKIEELTERSYGELEHKWCVDAVAKDYQMTNPEWSKERAEEEAKKYCSDCRGENTRLFATDVINEEKRREVKTEISEKITEQVNSDLNPFSDPRFSDKMRQDHEDTVQYCIKKRTESLGSLYSPEYIEKYCREMFRKADSLTYGSISREKDREDGKRTYGTVDQEYADRVYSMMAILDLGQAYCERSVKANMISEGKFADLNKHTFNRESVGDLYGKTRAQILKEQEEHE